MSHAAVVQSEEASLNKFHVKMVFTAGIGFFTDAYDLFIIGIVSSILAPIWHLSILQVALLNGAALASAAFGAVFFGFFSDRYGRKKLYGFEVLVLFCGAIISACSLSFVTLFIARLIVGFGIGGDYPSSAVVISENSTRKNRGFLVLLVFAMQAVGLIVGPSLASLLLASHLSHAVIWRILVGLGAVPAASVFYLRRNIQESPHYLRSKESTPVEVSRIVRDLAAPKEGLSAYDHQNQKPSLLSKKWLLCLFGTAGAWFLLDVAFYGNGISSVMIIDSIHPHATLLAHTMISAILFLVFAVPGYALAAKYVDKIGRKPLQFLGFFMMALMFALIAFIPNLKNMIPLFIILFGVSFFFVNFGPNTTTFLIPSEIYPTSIRARAHGISAAVGKLGAFVGAFLVPFFIKAYGVFSTMGFMSIVSVLGILVTIILPEMKNKSLSDVDAGR
ncbi:MAG: MFS transporter [Gammaproteobacteria bacterium CG_4_10_14_0_8_um_filter_38_16]|nr:MAG: MFS transporter [Gammaproteobacteria bacterium CG_4_10_14_0_8_um_filter_38_16]PJA04000.1 MAG: MFS transporter [Gammaproteobacteria bacterium CG_4_10_14_0_2_um_filter_38_22]PJB09609.1 MAG: MFS transporter [Gammaproteobacteria bacterium CG_4_9_14_3_um_filter_38_9]